MRKLLIMASGTSYRNRVVDLVGWWSLVAAAVELLREASMIPWSSMRNLQLCARVIHDVVIVEVVCM